MLTDLLGFLDGMELPPYDVAGFSLFGEGDRNMSNAFSFPKMVKTEGICSSGDYTGAVLDIMYIRPRPPSQTWSRDKLQAALMHGMADDSPVCCHKPVNMPSWDLYQASCNILGWQTIDGEYAQIDVESLNDEFLCGEYTTVQGYVHPEASLSVTFPLLAPYLLCKGGLCVMHVSKSAFWNSFRVGSLYGMVCDPMPSIQQSWYFMRPCLTVKELDDYVEQLELSWKGYNEGTCGIERLASAVFEASVPTRFY